MEINEYNPEGSDLRKFQLRMLEILKIVDEICRKHDIPYWLSGGTLLGAVRHGGFIPWDDDIDIEVRRKDYKRLLMIFEEELPKNYVIHNFKTDKSFLLPFTKIRDINSSMIEGASVDIDYKYKGAFIDIFPMERISKSAAIFSNWAFILAFKSMNVLRIKKIKGRFVFICLLHYFLVLVSSICRSFFIPKRRTLYYSALCTGYICKINQRNIFPLKQIYFEGYKFYGPNNINEYLESSFGKNYMVLPPKDKRIYHGSNFKVW